jgi:hypothetical protein
MFLVFSWSVCYSQARKTAASAATTAPTTHLNELRLDPWSSAQARPKSGIAKNLNGCRSRDTEFNLGCTRLRLFLREDVSRKNLFDM